MTNKEKLAEAIQLLEDFGALIPERNKAITLLRSMQPAEPVCETCNELCQNIDQSISQTLDGNRAPAEWQEGYRDGADTAKEIIIKSFPDCQPPKAEIEDVPHLRPEEQTTIADAMSAEPVCPNCGVTGDAAKFPHSCKQPPKADAGEFDTKETRRLAKTDLGLNAFWARGKLLYALHYIDRLETNVEDRRTVCNTILLSTDDREKELRSEIERLEAELATTKLQLSIKTDSCKLFEVMITHADKPKPKAEAINNLEVIDDLMSECDATRARIAALEAERDRLSTEVAELRCQRENRKNRHEAERDRLIEQRDRLIKQVAGLQGLRRKDEARIKELEDE